MMPQLRNFAESEKRSVNLEGNSARQDGGSQASRLVVPEDLQQNLAHDFT